MLFNSGLFIFGFLPLFLLGLFLLGGQGFRQAAIGWALIGSLVFYGWDDPTRLLPVLAVSILFNFAVGRQIGRRHSRVLLTLGIAGNLALLAYFKYTGFLLSILYPLAGREAPHVDISLPIGISFYTFTQIAYLIDMFRQKGSRYGAAEYALFVSYFPHLIAGPILHHKEIMPQFNRDDTFKPRAGYIALGLSMFAVGLFKKVIFADNIAPLADAAFKAASGGASISTSDAWLGVSAYALQIYFDFSGYSDMAIGLALMMGITFPLNFNSPYKSCSIIDFWRRWHITLSRFLRDYLYVPLGGNRRGPARRYLNLLITMLLGGLWHGASWNFVLWGAIHGLALAVNHLWRAAFSFRLPALVGWGLTMLLVLLAWVPFRADTFGSALVVWKAMIGLSSASQSVYATPMLAAIGALSVAAVALLAPNSQEFLSFSSLPAEGKLRWRPRVAWALGLGCVFGVAVAASLTHTSYFLYFRF